MDKESSEIEYEILADTDPFYIPPGSPTSEQNSCISSGEEECSPNIIQYEEVSPKGDSRQKEYIRSLEQDLDLCSKQNAQLSEELLRRSNEFTALLSEFTNTKTQLEEKEKDNEEMIGLIHLAEAICGDHPPLTRGGNPKHYPNYLKSKLEIIRSRMLRITNKSYALEEENSKLKTEVEELNKRLRKRSLGTKKNSKDEAGSKLLKDLQQGLSTCTNSLARLQKFQHLKQKYSSLNG